MYWQVEFAPEGCAKMALCTQEDFYEFNVMQFGLSNAPPTFCLMDSVLARL